MGKRNPSEALAAVVESGRALNVGELAEELISAFGGCRSFAQKYHQEFRDSKKGSISRAKILEGVMRVVGQATAVNKSREGDPSQMSNEELVDEIVRAVSSRGLAVDAQEKEPGASA